MSTRNLLITLVPFGLVAGAVAAAQSPVGTAFSFQGSLSTMGSPANGDFDFRFDLYDDPNVGGTVAPTAFVDDAPAVDGLFTVLVDFGAVFGTDALWIEVGVRDGGSAGPYTVLSPRQQVTPAPIALRATEGVGGSNALNVSATGNVGIGTQNPAEKLHVVGDIWATGGLRAGENSIYVGQTPPPASLLGDYVTASGGTVNFDDDNLVTTGQIGIGNGAPLADLHITGTAIALLASHLSFDDAVLEDTTAWLGLYSSDAAALGSGISLGQIANTPDKWSLFRGTALTGNDDLYVTYGTNMTNPAADTLMLRIRHDTGNTLLTPWMGNVGVGETSPERSLHVTNNGIANFSGFLSEEDAIVEDSTAWLGLYSEDNGGGGVGSGITLGEIVSDGNNKWAIYRRPSSNVGDLNITYGEDSNPGANIKMMQIRQDGDTLLTPVMGNVGIGVSSPTAKLHAYAENSSFSGPTVARFESRQTPGGFVFHRSLDFSGSSLNAYDIQNGGGTTLSLNFASDGDVQIARGGGDVGVGGVPSTKLHVINTDVSGVGSFLGADDAIVEDSTAWLGLYSDDGGGTGIGSGITLGEISGQGNSKWAIYRRVSGNVGDLNITYGSDSNPGANEKMLQIGTDGTVTVQVLEITGADLAERFPMSDTAKPGMVVEIDPDNPGQLRLAHGAYNRRVAGVISGAGGLSVGAILGNLPGTEDAPPVALSGRVWVYCDATEHAIQPGDLLTTAERSGHAMAVRDYAQATGATLGKAMGALAKGETGLVLVLVNLQ